MRVALVHDKLLELGGAERVVQAMQRIWPDAPLHVAVADPDVVAAGGFRHVVPTVLDRLPRGAGRGRWAIPLYGPTFARVRPADVDVVVSSSSFAAFAVRPAGSILHLSYVHTPARYLWAGPEHLEGRSGGRLASAAVAAAVPALRRYDRRAAKRVDALVANSRFVQQQVQDRWGRTSVVVPPPVDVAAHARLRRTGDHLVTLARLVPYKRVDAAIEVANQEGLHLVVIGDGPDRERLADLAGPTIELVGEVDEATKAELLGSARALLAPQVEDFGIAMVEAHAAGVPVVAPSAGGALDIVTDPGLGVLYDPRDPSGLVGAVRAVLDRSFDRVALRAAADRFTEDEFGFALVAQVEALLARPAP